MLKLSYDTVVRKYTAFLPRSPMLAQHCPTYICVHETVAFRSLSEPSLREKQYYADLLKKIDIAQKVLGQSYCILVLGEGIATQHHMECGRY